MHTRIVPVLVVVLCMFAFAVHVVEAQSVACVDAGVMGHCFKTFDRDNDGALDWDEFNDAYNSIGWYTRWMLQSPAAFFERCDQFDTGRLTPFDILAEACIETCSGQRFLYENLC